MRLLRTLWYLVKVAALVGTIIVLLVLLFSLTKFAGFILISVLIFWAIGDHHYRFSNNNDD